VKQKESSKRRKKIGRKERKLMAVVETVTLHTIIQKVCPLCKIESISPKGVLGQKHT